MGNEIRKTSSGEEITKIEFQRRRSLPEFCIDCGAPLLGIARIMTERCGPCSTKYYLDWADSSKGKSGSGGLFGSE